VSKSALVREAITRHLAKSKALQHLVSAYELAKDWCDIVKNAPPNLATNPKYMERFGEWLGPPLLMPAPA
jgi:hypothetical protein